MARPGGNPDGLIPFEKGSERTRQIAAMGREQARKNREAMKFEKISFKKEIEKAMTLQNKKGTAIDLSDCETYDEARKQVLTLMTEGILSWVNDFAKGNPRARSQFLELLQILDDNGSNSANNNGLADAIREATLAWKETNE